MEARMNEDWEIVGSIPLRDGFEVVLAHNQKNRCTPWVTWECKDGNNYYWGHYFRERDNAVDDLIKRAR